MKKTEYLKGLQGKDPAALGAELDALRKEQFNLRMQAATGQLTQTSRLGDVRKRIARVKTLMQQKAVS